MPRSPRPRERALCGSVRMFPRNGYLWIRFTHEGRDVKRSLRKPDTPENRRAARPIIAKIEAQLLGGDLAAIDQFLAPRPTKRAITLGELWGQYAAAKTPHVAPNTVRHYRAISKRLAMLPEAIAPTPDAIAQALLQITTPRVCHTMLFDLRAAWRWGESRGIVPAGRWENLPKIPGGRPLKRAIDPFLPWERDLICTAFDQCDRWGDFAPVIRFLFWSGVRTGEAFALSWGAVNLEAATIAITTSIAVDGTLSQPKRGKSRILPCSDALIDLLTSIRPSNPGAGDRVFRNVERNTLTRAWNRSGGQPGIVRRLAIEGKITRYRPPYNTRHTFASCAIAAGVSIPTLANWLGHDPKVTLSRYGTFYQGQKLPNFGK